MTSRRPVIAVVPAFNEVTTIGATVDALFTMGCVDVVVVDDGSTDATADTAMRHGASVHRLTANRGKGAALNAAFDTMDRRDADKIHPIYLLADADLANSASLLAPLVEAVQMGTHVAVADFTTPGGFGTAKTLARRGIAWMTGVDVRSPLSGQRAVDGGVMARLLPFPAGWGVEVCMTVRALRAGLTLVEIPLPLTHRATGRDWAGWVHRGRQCGAVVATLWRLARVREGVQP